MIVVDTNVLAYLYLPGDYTSLAERLLVQEPEWAAPVLWRSELRNVLALYLRRNLLSFEQAYAIQTEAESLMVGNEFELDSLEVLRLAESSRCAAYDCEFVALARFLHAPLVTMDESVLRNFETVAVSLETALASSP